jgi:hypothetical protein
MTAAVRVDGNAFALLGPLETQCPAGLAMPALPQLGPANIQPTRTIYSYMGASVAVNLTFATPTFLEDLDSFLPVSLVDISVAAIDGNQHEVQVFFELTGQLVVDSDHNNVSWARNGSKSMRIFNPTGEPLREYSPFNPSTLKGGQPTNHLDWGSAHLALPSTPSSVLSTAHTWMGSSNIARQSFLQNGSVPKLADESIMPLPACNPFGAGAKAGICRCAEGGNGALNDWPSLAVSWSIPLLQPAESDSVSGSAASAVHVGAVLSYDDLGKSARYFGKELPEYWRRNGRITHADMMMRVRMNYSALLQRCEHFDGLMVKELTAAAGSAEGAEDLAAIGALSYRQVLGDNSLVWFDGKLFAEQQQQQQQQQQQAAVAAGDMKPHNKRAEAGAPFLLVKGLGSSGDTGTIDDNYPAAFFYLWRQPELLNALLRPINIFMQNSTFVSASAPWPLNVTWKEQYSIHYLGQYPIAELQCWDNHYDGSSFCEGMPLEMTADNLQMTAAAALATGNMSTALEFWPLLQQYADYLVEHGLDPALQPCSDDYEGPSARNANLAAKAIVGIGAFAALCEQTQQPKCAAKYMQIARLFASNWTHLAGGGRAYNDNGHSSATGETGVGAAVGTKRASVRDYGRADSWSQKYNLLWDRVLGLGLFDAAIETECGLYMSDAGPNATTVAMRQKYGWYLDDRSENDTRHLTNSGWSEWTAAMCGPAAVADLYARIKRFAQDTPDRWALTDYYNAADGRRLGFEGRAQMGGFGASLAIKKYPRGLLPHARARRSSSQQGHR